VNKKHFFRYLGAFSSVGLTLATALTLRAGKGLPLFSVLFVLMIAVVMGLNVAKLVIWGALNRRYDLSHTYPLTALFFPAIFITALILGDTSLSLCKLVGLILIMTGLIYFERYGVRV